MSAATLSLPATPSIAFPRRRARKRDSDTVARVTPTARVGSDEDLMVRVQAGDEAALEQLMARFQAPLYAFLSRRVGSAADDLFQETWIRVVRAADRFDPKRRFSTWMFQIANNLCRDRWRRLDARRRAHEGYRSERDATDEAPSVAPRDRALERTMDRRLDALPDRLREVLILRYYHDFSEREIAEAVGVPTGTVKSRMHAAVKALRAIVAEEEAAGDEGTGDA